MKNQASNNEKTDLLNNSAVESFQFSSSIYEELSIILKLYFQIVFQNLFIYLPTSTANIWIGHLPNYSELMSGSALSRSFTEVTGTSIAWGMNAALKTLIPQAIGDDNNQKQKLLAIYFQRALLINCIINVPVSLIQVYAGSIMCALHEPSELCSIATTYCRSLIPFLWFCAIFTSLQRVGQCVNLNNYIFFASFITAILSIPLNYLLVFTLDFGYIGTAITVDICYGLSIVILIGALCQKGYSFLFKPLPLSIICTYDGIKQYLGLALPNVLRLMCSWWTAELFILLAGYVANPDNAIAASSILYGFDLNLIMVAISMNTVIAVRVGKYIGAKSWEYAKTSFFCALFVTLLSALAIASIVWIFHDKIPLLWGTNNQEIVYCASNLFYIEGFKIIVWGIYHAFGGLLLGLGLPNVFAVTMFITMWGGNLSFMYIMLVVEGWRYDTLWGLIAIWISPVIFRVVSVLIFIIIIVWFVDIDSVINKSTMRIKQTMKDYGSFGQNKRKRKISTSLERIMESI